MGLVDLKTDLKSLRYGKDRIGGGSSNQPYKTRPIPDSISDTDVTGGPDFLLRGGTLALRNSVRDVSRLSQMFFDLKSPNGLLFTAKQNVLSLTNVNSNVGYKSFQEFTTTNTDGRTAIGRFISKTKDFLTNNISLNQGAYTPLSTIGQSAGNSLGIHLNKQGINPLASTGGDSNGISVGGFLSDFDPLGLPTYLKTISTGGNEGNRSRLLSLTDVVNDKFTSDVLYTYKGGPGAILGIGQTVIKVAKDRTGDNNVISLKAIKDSSTFTLTGNQLSKETQSKWDSKVKEDFRKKTQSGVLSLNYTRSSIEQRVNLGNPGTKGNVKNFTRGKVIGGKVYGPLDTINARSIYKTDDNNPNIPETNDLVKFRIGVIDNENPQFKTNIHFRAFIDNFNDSYTSDWQSQKFMGRGENFYRYGGFDRSISLSWTVAAQSKQELIPMHQKLNYLASVCAPDYSKNGYMRGNLVRLTIGGYLYEQVGIIRSITYDIPQESPWEIAVSAGEDGKSDPTVKELPHIIKVTGFQFTPIHDFIPSVQKNNFKKEIGGIEEIDSYGPERYIALNNGFNNNYEDRQRVEPLLTGSTTPIAPLQIPSPPPPELIL